MRKIIVAFALLAAAWAARADYTRNVAIVIYENAEPLDWTGPFEVYNDAAGFGSANGQRAFRVYTVSKTTAPLSSQGMKVVPDYSIADAPQPDILIIPGGQSNNVSNDVEFMNWIKSVAPKTQITQTVCTGAFVLAKAGLLDNLEVTTWYGAIAHLREAYPKVTVKDGRRFIDNGRYVTTAGISAGIDGSLHVIARLLGRRNADNVARYMEYHWTPEAYLAKNYSYLNPSTDDRGRTEQSADMQADEKNYVAAAKTYRELLAGHEDNGSLWMALGTALAGSDDHAAAADAYTRASASMPHGGYTYFLASVEFAKAKQNDRAAEMLTKAWTSGFHEPDMIANEVALATVREDPKVKQAMK